MTGAIEKRVRVTDRGQMTIPKEIREATGIAAPSDVIVRRHDSGEVVIEPIPTVDDLHGYLDRDGEGVENADDVLTESRRADAESVERLVDESRHRA